MLNDEHGVPRCKNDTAPILHKSSKKSKIVASKRSIGSSTRAEGVTSIGGKTSKPRSCQAAENACRTRENFEAPGSKIFDEIGVPRHRRPALPRRRRAKLSSHRPPKGSVIRRRSWRRRRIHKIAWRSVQHRRRGSQTKFPRAFGSCSVVVVAKGDHPRTERRYACCGIDHQIGIPASSCRRDNGERLYKRKT